MRIPVAVLALVCPAAVAHADAPAVNLLSAVPSVVAVSSTVANGAILPAHLVDGKLDTAWNSRTGELVGAWVGARLPAGVTVESIRLTVGFTKVDKQWGDLFTMNPRIKRVRVTRDGALVADAPLDPALRTLQTIALPKGAGGGDYKIEVAEIVAGTRADWKEINISELEVWGRPGAAKAAAPQKPIVRVGGFERPPLSQAECVRAMFTDIADAGTVTKFVALDLPNDVAVCQVEYGDASPEREQTCSIAVFKRGGKLALIGKLPDLKTHRQPPEAMGNTDDEVVQLSAFPLSRGETALRLDDSTSQQGTAYAAGSLTTQLYRVTQAGAPNILEHTSTWQGGDRGGTYEKCDLDAVDLTASLPAKLTVSCTGSSSTTDDRGHETTHATDHVDKYRWNGRAYAAP